MPIQVATPAARKLFHEGILALSNVEANGIRIDTDYLDKALTETKAKVKEIETDLREDSVFKTWQREFGLKTDLNKPQQLARVLFGKMGYPCAELTATGKAKMDEDALEDIDLPFVKKYIHRSKLQKVNGTFLKGIKDEVCNGFLHAFYHLNTAISLRGSSSDPNFQNFPIRDPEQSEIIRRCFIARKNCVLVETDFGGIEVRVAACNNKDPVLISYINDKTKDMHRDMACECFLIEPSDVTKQIRYCAKNMFVFPEFYGSYYINCAKDLWKAMVRLDLEVGIIPMRGWLEDKGITKLGILDPNEKPKKGTFERHIKTVEDAFWNDRFKVYTKWKDWLVKKYTRDGGFLTLTGFWISGDLRRNQIINFPVQGPAFHSLLWCLTRINKLLIKNKMKSRIVGQIHDSIVADVHIKEKDDYLEMTERVMKVQLPKAMPWWIVPVEAETEIAPLGGSWFDKKKVG